MNQETYGVDPHQDVQDCVKDFQKLHEPEVEDVPDPQEPNREAQAYVAKGRLDPETGYEIPPTDKSRTCQTKQFGTISAEYLRNYDLVRWD